MAASTEILRLTPARGHSIVAERFAGSGPGYLFLHGLASNRVGNKSDLLLAHARQQGRAFCRFDFRGHGESSGTRERLTLTTLLEDADAALAACGPSVLIGSSLGGLVAAWLAARAAERVTGLVLLAPAFGFLPRLESRPLVDGHFSIDSSPTPTRLHQSVLTDARRYDEAALPARLRVPLLLVHGECDETVPVAESQRFFDRIDGPRKRLWIVPGGDHRLEGAMAEICRLIEGFFPAVPPPPQ